MRIAASGANRKPKTSLIEAPAEFLPDHEAVDEPYNFLLEEGYDFMFVWQPIATRAATCP